MRQWLWGEGRSRERVERGTRASGETVEALEVGEGGSKRGGTNFRGKAKEG